MRRCYRLTLCLLITGCAVGPDYEPPEMALAKSFSTTEVAQSSAEETLTSWWRSFDDQQLEKLIGEAVGSNKDITAAISRVNEVRALKGAKIYDLYPTIESAAEYQNSRSSEALDNFGNIRDRDTETYTAGFDAFWEIDIFGRVRRSVEQSEALESASLAELQDVTRIVIAEVARYYFILRGAQAELDVARGNAANQENTVKFIETRFKLGASSEFDLVRAKTQLHSTQATIPPLESAVKTSIHRLGVLTGVQPQTLITQLELPAKLPQYVGPVALGDPASLIRRRPDVNAAERRLAAATAGIGVAEGELFPKLTFTGTLVVQASQADRLGDGAGAYTMLPRISWPAFNFGRVHAKYRAAEAQAQTELALYERSVLTALEELENSLTKFGNERKRRDLLQLASSGSAKATEIATAQYRDGLANFLDVLEAQRAQLLAEAQLSISETQLSLALVDIYKSLGGGWQDVHFNEQTDSDKGGQASLQKQN